MEQLKELGLTKYERLVYSTLLMYGKSTGKQIAAYSQVPQTAVYPTLTTLLEKQLIQKFDGDPSLFEALEPTLAINNYVKQKKRRIDNYKNNVLEEIKNIKKQEKTQEKQVLMTTHGRGISAAIYLDVMPKVKKTFYILGWRLVKVGDKYKFLREFKKLVGRGIDVRIILTGPLNKEWKLVDEYIKGGIQVKYLPLDNFSIFVVDQEECKISLKDRNLPEKINMRILDTSFSKAMHNYFLEMWEKASSIKSIKPKQ